MYTPSELSILYELRDANIKEEDIEYILNRVKNRLDEKNVDIELEKLGYQKIFTVDYDENNPFDIEFIEE
jgi:hypothetical protein